MNRLKYFVLLAAAVVLAACGADNGYAEYADELEYVEEAEYVEEIEDDETEDLGATRPVELPWNETSLSLEEAAYYLARLQAMWDADNGEMWGVPLDVPVTFFCNDTKIVVSSHQHRNGGFVRQYVGDFGVYVGIAEWMGTVESYRYTSDWGGRTGTLVSWQTVERRRLHYWLPNWDELEHYLARDSAVLILINHLNFHAIQPILGIPSGTPWEMLQALPAGSRSRISFELEFNALIYALNNEGDARLAAVHDALSIRHDRHQSFGSGTAEAYQMMGEGTAVYTEFHLLFNRDEINAIIQYWPLRFASPYARAAAVSGYFGGALYGMLLDDFGVDWRLYARRGVVDFGCLLREALGITELRPLDEIDLERFGYSEIAARINAAN